VHAKWKLSLHDAEVGMENAMRFTVLRVAQVVNQGSLGLTKEKA
jgi:hypothetical protein